MIVPAGRRATPGWPAKTWPGAGGAGRQRSTGAAELGLIGSLGIAEVTHAPPPQGGVLSTGDELASIGQPLAPGRSTTATATPCSASSQLRPRSSTSASSATSRKTLKPPRRSRRCRRCGADQRRRLLWGGRFRPGNPGPSGPGPFWKLDIKTRPPHGLRPHRQGLAVRPAGQPGGGDGELPSSPSTPAAPLRASTCRPNALPQGGLPRSHRSNPAGEEFLRGRVGRRPTAAGRSAPSPCRVGVLRSIIAANRFTVPPEEAGQRRRRRPGGRAALLRASCEHRPGRTRSPRRRSRPPPPAGPGRGVGCRRISAPAAGWPRR